ncbi:AT-hook motif nuclear-localized protein 9 [Linum grandiflorum]
MDRSGSASFYTQRGIPGSTAAAGLNMSNNSNNNSNQLVASVQQYQPNMVGLPMEPPPPPPQQQQNQLVVLEAAGTVMKRKRGRPRKYGPDGTASLALSPSMSSSSTHPGTITPTTTQKRGRGRPPGSGKKQQLIGFGDWISGSAGIGFTPHIITVAVGEDIATKIMSFSQQGPRAICILSANGAVSTVTLTQPSTSGGTVTYEGRFEILCLSGSYLLTEITGSRNRAGGLSVSLASPDGRVFGGGVGGMLIAASPVQVIVGSFIWGGPKTKNKKPEGSEGGRESEQQHHHHHHLQPTHENPVSPTSGGVPPQPGQNLAPASPGAGAGMWPGSRPLDMHHSHSHHHDIDLMRG